MDHDPLVPPLLGKISDSCQAKRMANLRSAGGQEIKLLTQLLFTKSYRKNGEILSLPLHPTTHITTTQPKAAGDSQHWCPHETGHMGPPGFHPPHPLPGRAGKMINQQLLGSVQAASCKPKIPKLATTSWRQQQIGTMHTLNINKTSDKQHSQSMCGVVVREWLCHAGQGPHGGPSLPLHPTTHITTTQPKAAGDSQHWCPHETGHMGPWGFHLAKQAVTSLPTHYTHPARGQEIKASLSKANHATWGRFYSQPATETRNQHLLQNPETRHQPTRFWPLQHATPEVSPDVVGIITQQLVARWPAAASRTNLCWWRRPPQSCRTLAARSTIPHAKSTSSCWAVCKLQAANQRSQSLQQPAEGSSR